MENGARGSEERNGHETMKLCEVLRDGLCVHQIVRGLRGKEREMIETVLNELAKELRKRDPNERDIMQVVAGSDQLDGELYRAFEHLLGNKSTYLDSLIWLAQNRHDWRGLPNPSNP